MKTLNEVLDNYNEIYKVHNGMQTEFVESYVSTGSPYHMTTFFLPLGLSSKHPFWSTPSESWTGKKAFEGKEFIGDHALNDLTLRESVNIELSRLIYLFKLRFSLL